MAAHLTDDDLYALTQLQGWLEDRASLWRVRDEPGDRENADWANHRASLLAKVIHGAMPPRYSGTQTNGPPQENPI